MVPDRQKVRTDGQNGRTEGQTDARTTPKLYPSDFVVGLINLDALDSENRTYSLSILISLYNNICFGCIKEMYFEDISLTQPNYMFDKKKQLLIINLGSKIFYVYLHIIRTTVLTIRN